MFITRSTFSESLIVLHSRHRIEGGPKYICKTVNILFLSIAIDTNTCDKFIVNVKLKILYLSELEIESTI